MLYTPNNFLGFDDLFKRMEQEVAKKHQNFPKYNIIKVTDEEYLIEMALAGYKKDDLSVTIEENVLTVSSNGENEDSREYTVKGITNKAFKKDFFLGEHVVVEKSHLVDGILSVFLKLEIPEEKKPKTISID